MGGGVMASDRAPPLAGADAVRSFVKRYVETHREHLMGIARPIVASRDEAEDAVREGALRVLRRGLARGPHPFRILSDGRAECRQGPLEAPEVPESGARPLRARARAGERSGR